MPDTRQQLPFPRGAARVGRRGRGVEMAARRSYGTGSLYVRGDGAGRETRYGKWHANGRRRPSDAAARHPARTGPRTTYPRLSGAS